MPRPLLYVAYPMRLDLRAANAIQTYNTVRELQKLTPGTRLVVPRWLREPSAFSDLHALHLPRPAVNKLSRFVPWTGWSYIERTLYAWMLVILLVCWRLTGRGYKVLYVRDVVVAAWLCLFDRAHGSSVIYEVHDLEAQHPSKAARWPHALWSRLLPWLDRVALSRSRRVVSLTETFRQWAAEQNLRDAGDIVVIPDAFDPAIYMPRDKEEARQALGLPVDAFVIAYAGLTFAYRRLDLLVEAFAKVARTCDNALLALVGGRSAEVAELRAQAERLGLPGERLITPGQVGQARVALYLNAADVLVIPDTVTGLTASPLKLFEYIAVGRPVVLKDMPALREILDSGMAEYFPEGDADALAESIRRLMDNPERAAEIAAKALERSQSYTYHARAEKIAKVARSC